MSGSCMKLEITLMNDGRVNTFWKPKRVSPQNSQTYLCDMFSNATVIISRLIHLYFNFWIDQGKELFSLEGELSTFVCVPVKILCVIIVFHYS